MISKRNSLVNNCAANLLADIILVIIFSFAASEIHHRFSGMRTTYRSNAIKVGASKTTGADGGQVYVPSWPHYNSMQFLDASKPTRKSVTSFTIFDENDLSLDEEANPSGMEVDSETEANKTQSENQESESSSSSTSRKSGKQSSKLTPTKGKRNNEDVALECLNVLRSINKENDSPIPIATKEPLDRSVVFGEFVTASLTDMSQWNRTLAMGEISNVLVKYDPNNPNKV